MPLSNFMKGICMGSKRNSFFDIQSFFYKSCPLVCFWGLLVLMPIMAYGKAKKEVDRIDIVYTWVDGQDPYWQEARSKFCRIYSPLISINDSNVKNRFRDREELKYSLRSVYQFANFVNHIFIITYQQVPSWLKPHPKITIIDHQDIFACKDDLPTFNSHAIEANLHRIPNLSEKFLYLNDDMFFGSKVVPADFFTADGKIKVFHSPKSSPDGEIIPGEITYRSAWKNTNRLLNENFVVEDRYHLVHAPYALKKKLMHQTERWFPAVFRSVSSHKFRLSSDYTITNGLVQYYAHYTNQSEKSQITNHTVWFGSDYKRNIYQLMDLIKKRYKTFCIEDTDSKDMEMNELALKQFFETYFPKPAPWEKIKIDMQIPDQIDEDEGGSASALIDQKAQSTLDNLTAAKPYEINNARLIRKN